MTEKPILTVTLNPAIDRTYTVPGFSINAVHRAGEFSVTAGGKGINVARVYRTLGGDALATGFLGGTAGAFIEQALDRDNIPHAFQAVSAETRICLKVIDPVAGTQTELNEAGPHVTSGDFDVFRDHLRALLPGHSYVVLSGSVPPGTPKDCYARMIHIAQDECGIPAVLDTSGEALKLGIEARPFMVKPNVFELADLGISSETIEMAALLLRERFEVSVAVVTAGSSGAALSMADGLWRAVPPRIDVKSAVGSGDALTAGFLWALAQGKTGAEALALGIGAGAANAMSAGPGFCERGDIVELAAQTTVRIIR